MRRPGCRLPGSPPSALFQPSSGAPESPGNRSPYGAWDVPTAKLTGMLKKRGLLAQDLLVLCAQSGALSQWVDPAGRYGLWGGWSYASVEGRRPLGCARRAPVPRRELVEATGRQVIDSGQDIRGSRQGATSLSLQLTMKLYKPQSVARPDPSLRTARPCALGRSP